MCRHNRRTGRGRPVDEETACQRARACVTTGLIFVVTEDTVIEGEVNAAGALTPFAAGAGGGVSCGSSAGGTRPRWASLRVVAALVCDRGRPWWRATARSLVVSPVRRAATRSSCRCSAAASGRADSGPAVPAAAPCRSTLGDFSSSAAVASRRTVRMASRLALPIGGGGGGGGAILLEAAGSYTPSALSVYGGGGSSASAAAAWARARAVSGGGGGGGRIDVALSLNPCPNGRQPDGGVDRHRSTADHDRGR